MNEAVCSCRNSVVDVSNRESTESRNTQLVRCAIKSVWQDGDLELADTLFAATYINHGGLIPDAVSGPESIKFSIALCHVAFPMVHITIDSVRADGDTVALGWSASMLAPEVAGASSRTGQCEMLKGTTISRIVGDQIAESWTTWQGNRTGQRLSIVDDLVAGTGTT